MSRAEKAKRYEPLTANRPNAACAFFCLLYVRFCTDSEIEFCQGAVTVCGWLSMKRKPILFSRQMIRALLQGRKAQTRRVVNPQPLYSDFDANDPEFLSLCQYGQPGDLLWVRETWAPVIGTGNSFHIATGPADDASKHQIKFRADPDAAQVFGSWKPSIHMPRWASRLTLEITVVRVERVQDISRADAVAEGCERPLKGTEIDMPDAADERTSFAILWNSINAERGYGWEANPRVWVIEFRVHKCNVDDLPDLRCESAAGQSGK